jgi:hypothetical protein
MQVSGQLYAPYVLSTKKEALVPLIRRMDVLKHHSGCFGKEKPLLQLPQIKSQFFDCPAYSLVIIPTTTSRLKVTSGMLTQNQ